MLDKMYSDLVNNVMPKIAEGVIITKDYFVDLFGRYVEFILVWDSTMVVISVLTGIVLALVFHGCVKRIRNAGDYNDPDYKDIDNEIICSAMALCFFVINGVFFLHSLKNLFMTLYVPEIRVYEIFMRGMQM